MIVGDGVYDIGLVLVAALAGYLDDDIDPGHDLPAVARAWAQLPEVYRRADDGTLHALLAAMLETAAALELLVDAIDYRAPDEGGTDTGSILTDPERTLWPEWLAQAVGVNLRRAGITDLAPFGPARQDITEAILGSINGRRAGSEGALAAAARRTLTGSRTVRVRALAGADPHIITVSTAADETPDPDALRAAVEAVLPAGHKLDLDNNVGNWRGIEAAQDGVTPLEDVAPTWADIQQLYEPVP